MKTNIKKTMAIALIAISAGLTSGSLFCTWEVTLVNKTQQNILARLTIKDQSGNEIHNSSLIAPNQNLHVTSNKEQTTPAAIAVLDSKDKKTPLGDGLTIEQVADKAMYQITESNGEYAIAKKELPSTEGPPPVAPSAQDEAGPAPEEPILKPAARYSIRDFAG